jgi:hypothetical protein
MRPVARPGCKSTCDKNPKADARPHLVRAESLRVLASLKGRSWQDLQGGAFTTPYDSTPVEPLPCKSCQPPIPGCQSRWKGDRKHPSSCCPETSADGRIFQKKQ